VSGSTGDRETKSETETVAETTAKTGSWAEAGTATGAAAADDRRGLTLPLIPVSTQA
jgi:hypothetical protein